MWVVDSQGTNLHIINSSDEENNGSIIMGNQNKSILKDRGLDKKSKKSIEQYDCNE
jgi:hypothetical protein